ncbi:MAG: hypothetical protein ACI9NT_000799 [Bacteroidia bacterium]|jgi:hypothetical protein
MQTKLRWAIAGMALVLVSACSSPDSAAPPLPDVHLANVPNLSQSGGGFDEDTYDPEQLCAPVAVSNSLMWLQANSDPGDQLALVNRLASTRYMLTSPSVGTGPAGVIRGVRWYLGEQGMAFSSLGYTGLRDVSTELIGEGDLSLAWLHSGVNSQSAVWVNFGWYEEVMPGTYRRKGGHWMTLVGFDGGKLVLHDPADGSVVTMPVTVRPWRLLRLESWKLAGHILEVPAKQAHRGDYALIDGAVKLVLAPEVDRGP